MPPWAAAYGKTYCCFCYCFRFFLFHFTFLFFLFFLISPSFLSPYSASYISSSLPLLTQHTVTQILVAYSADHFNARGLHSAALALIGAVGFIASALLPPDAYLHRYGCLIVATSGSFACIPPMLGWLTSNLHTTASVGLAIAINVSFGAGLGQMRRSNPCSRALMEKKIY